MLKRADTGQILPLRMLFSMRSISAAGFIIKSSSTKCAERMFNMSR